MGLANAVFLWGFEDNKINKIVHNDDNNLVSGIKFDESLEKLVISDLSGKVDIFDLEKKKKIQSYYENSSWVGALSLMNNKLLTGNKQG